ncbi:MULTISPECIES: hypothetical protein [unclassified Anabaena]|uniref:hypothetical protein n=1 Tax=unclassified Anabaena TaxID=2619674 RepID=UPI00144821F7|nr:MULTISPECIES: hypothetical protein [unclassified Anabaena]MTJ08139.1 hypothetical protein [Anabaena sp. UHCC 0204]MTJ53376.1 hypothetical protein [Anabaena sp. UHCC 0253]
MTNNFEHLQLNGDLTLHDSSQTPLIVCAIAIDQVLALFCQIGKMQYLKGLRGLGFDILCSNFIF